MHNQVQIAIVSATARAETIAICTWLYAPDSSSKCIVMCDLHLIVHLMLRSIRYNYNDAALMLQS